VLITAAQRSTEDSNVKLIDPHGQMLDSHWILYANEIIALE
jgi:hypothetical protein